MRYVFATLLAAFSLVVDIQDPPIANLSNHPSKGAAETTEVVSEKSPTNPLLMRRALAEVGETVAPPPLEASPIVPSSGPDASTLSIGNVNEATTEQLCDVVKNAAQESGIPVGFFVRLLWQESRFRSEEVSPAGAQGIAQFMPTTAAEMGLSDPFDPRQAIPASARLLQRLHARFGNLGLAAAAYNAGGGRIEKWLSRRASLPKETRAYVGIITGAKPEEWTAEANTVSMKTALPKNAPCEQGGDPMAKVTVALSSSISNIIRKAEAEAVQIKEKTVRLARKAWPRKFHRSPSATELVNGQISKIRLGAARPKHSPKLAGHHAVRLASAIAR